MKIISTTHPKAKQAHKCSLCGESIETNTQYEYVRYRHENKLKHLKCHTQCLGLAENLKLLDQETISSYWFLKSITNFLVDAVRRTKKPDDPNKKVLTVKAVRNATTAQRIVLAEGYFKVVEEVKAQKEELVTVDTAKAFYSASCALFCLSTCFDAVEEDLSSIGKFRHNDKRKLKQISEDFVVMGADLYETFDIDMGDDLYTTVGDILEQVQGSLYIEGVDNSCNVLMAILIHIKEKFLYMHTKSKLNVAKNIYHLNFRMHQLKQLLNYESYPFVQAVVDKAFKDHEFIIKAE